MVNSFRLDFKNLGPLKHGRLKLRDFNLICGVNNSGKTYLTYLLFGVLKMHWGLSSQFINMFDIRGKFEEEEPEWKKSGSVRIPENKLISLFEEIVTDANTNIEYYINNNLEDGKYGKDTAFLANIFNTNAQLFRGISYKRIFDFQFSPNQTKELLINTFKNRRYAPRISGLVLDWLDKELLIKTSPSFLREYGSMSIAKLVTSLFFRVFAEIWPRPYLLSTERSSISLFFKELDENRNALVDSLQRLGNIQESDKTLNHLISEKSSRFSEPVAVNIERIRNIPYELDKGRIGPMWQRYGQELQKRFDELNDGFTYSWDEGSQQFYYILRNKEGRAIQVPLYAGSSMSRELFDLYYYLRLYAAHGDIIITDEPESYLHPQKQMQLTRLLAFLTNHGIRILLTTHSDFIVREVNNLILANELKSNKFGIENEERLDKDNVSCCETVESEGENPKCFTLEEREIHSYGVGIKAIDRAIDGQASAAAKLYDDLQEKNHGC